VNARRYTARVRQVETINAGKPREIREKAMAQGAGE
jgi:hypothetical protein